MTTLARTTSRDGTSIATMTAGQGPPLLLVHGGMCSSARWGALRPLLTPHRLVTAMDRRGRGRSGDGGTYSLQAEADDVRCVVDRLAATARGPLTAFGHSFGATCALAAVAAGAPVDRLVLFEPPGPETVPLPWRRRVTTLLAAGETGRAVMSFLVDVVGLAPERVVAMRDSPAADDAIDIAARTIVREADVIATTDLECLAERVTVPVMLLLGTGSPAWAGAVTHRLAASLADATVVLLPGCDHEAVDEAPDVVAEQLLRAVPPSRR